MYLEGFLLQSCMLTGWSGRSPLAYYDTPFYAHLLLRTRTKTKKHLVGQDFWSKSDPYESSGRADTSKLHRIAVRTPWDWSRGLKPENPKYKLKTSLTAARWHWRLETVLGRLPPAKLHVDTGGLGEAHWHIVEHLSVFCCYEEAIPGVLKPWTGRTPSCKCWQSIATYSAGSAKQHCICCSCG